MTTKKHPGLVLSYTAELGCLYFMGDIYTAWEYVRQADYLASLSNKEPGQIKDGKDNNYPCRPGMP